MKLNKMKTLTMFIALTTVLLFVTDCKESGGAKKKDPTALLMLVNVPRIPNTKEATCAGIYGQANSCINGKQYFNPGVGCSSPNLELISDAQLTGLKTCVQKAVNDPIQPCNLPQFTYASAAVAIAGVFKTTCTVADVTVSTTTAGVTSSVTTKSDLTGFLKF